MGAKRKATVTVFEATQRRIDPHIFDVKAIVENLSGSRRKPNTARAAFLIRESLRESFGDESFTMHLGGSLWEPDPARHYRAGRFTWWGKAIRIGGTV